MNIPQLDALTEEKWNEYLATVKYCAECGTRKVCITYHVGGTGDVQRWECPECDLKERE